MRLQHTKNLFDRIKDIEWLAEVLEIDTQKYSEFNSKLLQEKFWKMLEDKKIKDKFKVYIGEWK
jgi:hypothetical protein